VPGGKGLNVARVARELGADVQVVGIAAGATGRWLAGALDDLGVPARWVWTAGESRTCTSIAEDEADASLTEFYEPGPTVSQTVWCQFTDLVRTASQGAGWLAVSGSLPPGPGSQQLSSLLAAAATYTAVDVAGQPLAAATSERVDVVKLNASETLDLLGDRAVGREHSLPWLSRELRRCCGETTVAIVTGGRAGAVLSAPGEPLLWGGVPVTGRYPVGSGDSFLAGLLTARQQNASWKDALRLATAAAAANAELPGAGVLAADRVHELLPLVDIEEVRG
jgi:1-phosphofructokinase family hexose kinase